MKGFPNKLRKKNYSKYSFKFIEKFGLEEEKLFGNASKEKMFGNASKEKMFGDASKEKWLGML